MNRALKYITILFTSVILLTGCFGNDIELMKFYIIEIPHQYYDEATPEKPMIDKYCEIVTVDIDPSFAGFKIANRNATNKITYYQNHQWSVLPEDELTRFIYNYHDLKHTFKGISRRYWKLQPDLRFETYIDHMEISELNDKFMLHFKFKFSLIDNKNEEIVDEHRVDLHKELSEKSINAFAQAVSRHFYYELDKFNSKLR